MYSKLAVALFGYSNATDEVLTRDFFRVSSNCTTAIVDRRRDSNPQGLSTTEPYVLRIGSQLCFGGDEVLVR